MTEAAETFVRTLGQGRRKMLALHCTIAHSRAWSGVAAALDGQAQLIAPDMLSHGSSPDWQGQGDFFDEVTRLTAAQLTEPMDVIGHSFGGMIALRLAVDYPDLVRSAALIEPVFFKIARQDARALFEQHERDMMPVIDAFAAGDNPLAARLFNRLWSSQDSPRWPDLPERSRAAMVRGVHVLPYTNTALYEDSARLLEPDRIGRAKMPVLILNGGQSHPVMSAICDGLAARLPGGSRATVPDAGHMLPITHPRETAAHLRDFCLQQGDGA